MEEKALAVESNTTENDKNKAELRAAYITTPSVCDIHNIECRKTTIRAH